MQEADNQREGHTQEPAAIPRVGGAAFLQHQALPGVTRYVMLPAGTRTFARAQGSPRALHCTFCCYTDAAQGIAEPTWIPKAMAVSRDYSPAATQSYLEDSRLCLHSQRAFQSCKRNFTLTSSSQGLAEGSQERQLLPLNLTLPRRQNHQSDTFQYPMKQRKTRNKKRRWGPSKAPRCFWHTGPP